jgi:hypothetical protein
VTEREPERLSLKDFAVPASVLAVLALAVFLGVRFIAGQRDDMQGRFADIHDVVSGAAENDDNPFVDVKLTQAQVDARDNVTQDIQTGKDDLQWKVLARADMRIIKKNGQDTAAPTYTKAIRALDGKAEQAAGYMFPLDKSDKQSHFLLSPYPPSCPYCLPAGPQELIEIRVKTPVTFTYDAVKIRGIFHLLKGKDVAAGMFYRMTDAAPVRN